jgi:hypothetical protein
MLYVRVVVVVSALIALWFLLVIGEVLKFGSPFVAAVFQVFGAAVIAVLAYRAFPRRSGVVDRE